MMDLLAQSSSTTGGGAAAGALMGAGCVFMVIYLAIIVLVVIGFWKTFAKAGEPGWAAIVPIYNLYILCKIAGRPWWWLLLMFIPIANIVVTALISIDIARAFGRSVAFGIGLWLLSPVFFCILGFGSAEYQGPSPTPI